MVHSESHDHWADHWGVIPGWPWPLGWPLGRKPSVTIDHWGENLQRPLSYEKINLLGTKFSVENKSSSKFLMISQQINENIAVKVVKLVTNSKKYSQIFDILETFLDGSNHWSDHWGDILWWPWPLTWPLGRLWSVTIDHAMVNDGK